MFPLTTPRYTGLPSQLVHGFGATNVQTCVIANDDDDSFTPSESQNWRIWTEANIQGEVVAPKVKATVAERDVPRAAPGEPTTTHTFAFAAAQKTMEPHVVPSAAAAVEAGGG